MPVGPDPAGLDASEAPDEVVAWVADWLEHAVGVHGGPQVVEALRWEVGREAPGGKAGEVRAATPPPVWLKSS